MLRAPRSLLALFIVLGLVAAACGDDGESSRRPTGSDGLTMAEMQVLGSHNSYHLKPSPEALAALELVSADLAADTDYGHEPIEDQLTTYGMRQLEIDVFADPDGGLFADRQALPVIGLPVESGVAALDEPGFKVLHVQDYDFETSCFTLVDCLTIVREWSDANPDHLPLMIYLEAKSDRVEDAAADGGVSLDGLPIDFTEPVPYTREVFDELEAEILSVFPPDRVFTPDELRRDRDTLQDAVLEDGWPTIEEMRGQVFFGLIDTGEDRDVYRGDAASLEGRLMFTSADPGDPDAAFIRVDDPIEDAELIGDLVTQGFLVRTRADTPGDQAVSGDTARREAAFASGAQYVSTDYYRPDTALSDYVVELPGGAVAVCNPVTARADCDPADLEE